MAHAQDFVLTTLYSWANDGFSLGSPNNGYPQGPLVLGADGNIYGATAHGGDNLGIAGTLFSLTPTGTFTTLTVLTGVGSGASEVPQGPLIQATDGSFYGTTTNISTIYRTTPQGATTFHHSFSGNDGGDPHGALVQATNRSFYGTTSDGGENSGKGTIYSLSLTDSFVVLHTFQDTQVDPNLMDGATPLAGLIQASNGTLYGTTSAGGTNGQGTIFQITTDGSYTVLYNFSGADGSDPEAALVQATDGNFYGTTVQGGEYNAGTIFQITPDGNLTTIYQFMGGADGAAPHTALIQAQDGKLYGCTRLLGGANGNGTIFSITMDGVLTVLYTFSGGADGVEPDSLVQAADGSFYGTTLSAGVNSTNAGTIFRLSVSGAAMGPGSVQLEAVNTTVLESTHSAALSVSRTGGSVGAISVTYATADDTAVAGTDYQATSGTLTWADGDASEKTITVPISNQNLTSGSTDFFVNLSAPTGGATLNAPVQATVTILDTASSANLESVTLLSPPTGITLTVNQPVEVRADVEALSGTLVNVEFYAIDGSNSSTDLGGTTNERAQVTWTPTATGNYTLQVVATDTSGNTQKATSAVTVVAAPVATPQTNLQAGVDGITVPMNTTVPVVAQAMDSAGNALQNVQFYLDGVPVAGSPVSAIRKADSKAADATTGTLFITNVIASKIQQLLTVVGTTASGVSSVSTAAIIYGEANASTPPAASISNLASGASVPTSAGQSVSVAATTGSQAIAKVQLVVDSQSVGTVTAAPFTFSLPALTAGSHVLSIIATDINALSGVSTPVVVSAEDAVSATPAFFAGETALSNGVYYLAFPNGNFFGYYSFLPNPAYIFHFDLGFEYVFDAADGKSGVYFYDFASSTFFYTSPSFPFPYLYDFSLNSVLYYYPDPSNAGHYNTNGVRYFYDFNTGQIITK